MNRNFATPDTIFLVFLLAGFHVSPTPAWAAIFYIFTIAAFIRLRRTYHSLHWLKYLLAPVTLICWFWISNAWCDWSETEKVWKYALAGIANLIFFVSGVHLFAKDRISNFGFRNIIRAIAVSGSLNAMVSIFLYIQGNSELARLHGYAETRHPILGGYIIALTACITAYSLDISKNVPARIFYSSATAACFLFVFLTGSRGAILALIVMLALYCVLRFPSKRGILLAAGIVFTILILIASFVYFSDDAREFAQAQILRGDSHRFAIWRDVYSHILERPVFGFGVATDAVFAERFTFPHSLYLSAAFYGGFIGLGLLILTFGDAVIRSASLTDKGERAFALSALSVPLVGGLTDLGQPIKPPSEEWYIIWLPLALAYGRVARNQSQNLIKGSAT